MKGFGSFLTIRDMLTQPQPRQWKRRGKVYPYSSTQQTRLLRKLMRITKK